MDGNREKQIKESHINQSADKKPGTQPVHVVIKPTSLTMGLQQKPSLDNRNEPRMGYSSHSPITQTKAKPVCLVLVPAHSRTGQQLPCKSITNQSERKILLLPHSVVKQATNASSQSALTNQSAKKDHALTVMEDHSQTSHNTTSDVQDSTTDSHSVFPSTSAKDDSLHSRVSSVGAIDSEALQKSHLTCKEKSVSSVFPVEVAPLLKVGQNTQLTDAENGLETTWSSQSGESSTHVSGPYFSSEDHHCENIKTSKDSKLEEENISDCPDSRLGMVPPHLVVMTASPKEIDYRIKAFLARKRAELDIQNVEEYCLHIGMNSNVCARVDATVHQHRKQKKRKFEFAPQPEEEAECTQVKSKDVPHKQLTLSVAHPILEERVANVEEHLRLGKPVPQDIYTRLKRIEDRILKLEGISPEYTYDTTVNLHPPRSLPKIKRRCTVDELDAKIAELQKKLKKKPDCTSQKDIVK